ncbi:MAG: methyl-accepting chemotaxis protein [Planctomycetes bacterium]|nr:methyl-accepting chemotaxis protein [Planctomycetota bacterium]
MKARLAATRLCGRSGRSAVAIAVLAVVGCLSPHPVLRAVAFGASAGIGWWLGRGSHRDQQEAQLAEPAEQFDPAVLLERAMTDVGSVVDAVTGRHVDCSDGIAQVQKLLRDAVDRLQDEFSGLTAHVAREAEFVARITEQIERQTSLAHEDSFSNLAIHLKSVLGDSSAQMLDLGAKSVEISRRFDDMSRTGDSMLTLLEQADSIRSETTILAMNAAIEAARAGEHGRAFGQVAAEVRELSKKARSFNDELAGRTREVLASIDAARRAAMAMEECDLDATRDSTARLDRILGEIESSNASMAAGLRQLQNSRAAFDRHVAEAVTALQFEDLARQRLEAVAADLGGAANGLRDIGDSIRSGQVHRTVTDAEVDAFCGRLEAVRLACSERARITVAQTDMGEGDVELF